MNFYWTRVKTINFCLSVSRCYSSPGLLFFPSYCDWHSECLPITAWLLCMYCWEQQHKQNKSSKLFRRIRVTCSFLTSSASMLTLLKGKQFFYGQIVSETEVARKCQSCSRSSNDFAATLQLCGLNPLGFYIICQVPRHH